MGIMKMINEQLDLIDYFKQNDGHGNGLILKGKVRIGKTFLLGILTRILLMNGFYVISNVRFADIEFEKYKNQLFYMITDKDFFEAYLQIPENSKIIVVFDDSQAKDGFTSKGVMTKEGKKLSTFLIFIGKFEANYIYVAHQKYIPNSITEGFNPLIIYKFRRSDFYISDKLYENDNDVFSDINSYRIPVPSPDKFRGLEIKSKAIAVFDFILDLDNLISHLAKYEYGENLRLGVKDFFNQIENTDNEYNDLQSLTYTSIAKAIYLKRGYIKDATPLNEIINSQILAKVKKELGIAKKTHGNTKQN